MGKLVAIGDTHGRDDWKKISDLEGVDKFVFIGDYWDSRDLSFRTQMENFEDICEFKASSPDKVVMLVGNHDFHYMKSCTSSGTYYSGFQGGVSARIQELIYQNMEHLQMAFKQDEYLFTHAGVTDAWAKQHGYEGGDEAEFINDLFNFKPDAFHFVGRDPYGDSIGSSPIWVRPYSLMYNALNPSTLKQVVGHTGHSPLRVEADRFYFIDTLGKSKEYLILEDGKVQIGQL